MFHRVIFATDFSRGALRAQAYAAHWAHSFGAELKVLHVLEMHPTVIYPMADARIIESAENEISRQLDQITNDLGRCGVRATGMKACGIPSEEVVKAAGKEAADFIVLGTQGRTGLAHILLGSTAERVVRGAPCPVMTVHSASTSPSHEMPIAIKHILVPIDFSDCSLDALEYAIPLAKRFEASVTILHVLEWVSVGLDFSVAELAERTRVRKDTESRVLECAAVIRAQGLAAEAVIRGGGAPVDFVLECAGERGADMIIMGTHGRRGLSRLFIGSVAEAVLRQTACPVITLKSPKFAPGYQRVLTAVGRV
jgi:nucleotide-binding universal stress UspA family protein